MILLFIFFISFLSFIIIELKTILLSLMKFFIYLALICKTLTIDYKKNTDILMSKKFPHSRLKEIEDLNFLLEKIESQSTMMVLFHADSCHHW